MNKKPKVRPTLSAISARQKMFRTTYEAIDIQLNQTVLQMYEKIMSTLSWVLKKQVLMRIQFTLTIIIFFVMQVGANSVAQHVVTLEREGISLKDVFKEIKKQTDLTVFYSAKRLNDSRKVNTNFKNASLEAVLHECLKGLPLTYVIM